MNQPQYFHDSNGVPNAVLIPITAANKALVDQFMEELRITESIRRGDHPGLMEAKAIEAGKQSGTLAKDYLDALL